MKIRTKL